MDSEFVAPIGFDKLKLNANLNLNDGDLVLFRIPSELELGDLVGVKLNKPFKKTVKGVSHKYIVSVSEPGEMSDFKLLSTVPSTRAGVVDEITPTAFQLSSQKFTQFYHVGLDLALTPNHLTSAGETILKRPFNVRSQPSGLKVQSPPIGSDLEGSLLTESLARYPKYKIDPTSIVHPNKKETTKEGNYQGKKEGKSSKRKGEDALKSSKRAKQ